MGKTAQMHGGWFIPSHWPWLLPETFLPDSLCLLLGVQQYGSSVAVSSGLDHISQGPDLQCTYDRFEIYL